MSIDRAAWPQQDLAVLRAELAEQGYFKKATGAIVLRLLAAIALSLAGLAVFVFHPHPLVRICGILVSTFGSMSVGTNSHTASHYGTSDRKWLNELLTLFGYPLYLGLSATFWWNRHVAVHHRCPNVLGYDQDIEFAPYFAHTEADLAGSRGLKRLYYRFVQWLIFPLALAANGFSFMAAGWRYVLVKLGRDEERRPVHWLDLAMLLGHVGLWIGLPMVFFSPLDVLLVHALRVGLLGYTMFAVLGPGHLPREAICVRLGEEAEDYVVQQTYTTANFRTGPLGAFLCAGLQYQIEHHLFPGMSHVHYPKVAARVRELCRKHALPYHSFHWDVAIFKCWDTFRKPKAVSAVPRLPGQVQVPAAGRA